MKRFLSALFLFLLSVPAQAEITNPIVLEHFTMRSCTDYAAVNENVTALIEQEDNTLISLACHVSYDYEDESLTSEVKGLPDRDLQSTKPELAQKFCDERQKAYFMARATTILTIPQIIINGKYERDGMQSSLLDSSMRMARKHGRIKPLTLSVADNVLNLDLPERILQDNVDVLLFAYQRQRSVDDTEDVQLLNAVTDLKNIMSWDGTARTMSVPLHDMPADGYAVLIQRPDFRKILAAGKVEL